MDDRYFVGSYTGTVKKAKDGEVFDDFTTTNSYQEAWEWGLMRNKGFNIVIEDGKTKKRETYKKGEMWKEPELVDEAMAAPLLNVKNQLMKVLSDTFEFIGGSMVPKFTMKSKEEPDVSFDVTMTGNNVDVTPKYNGMPDTAHKKKGIALMRAVNVISDFVNSIVNSYQPAYAESYTKKLRIKEIDEMAGKPMKYAVYFTWKDDDEEDSFIADNAKERDVQIKDMIRRGQFYGIRYCPIYANGEYGKMTYVK